MPLIRNCAIKRNCIFIVAVSQHPQKHYDKMEYTFNRK